MTSAKSSKVRREADSSDGATDSAYLAGLGDRIRRARARRGMTRKSLSKESGISERYLAQLEAGRGNASIGVLRQIAAAMNLALVDLVDDRAEAPVELELITERLRALSTDELAEMRQMVIARFGNGPQRFGRIALIGLRGAGKSALGDGLAQALDVPFLQVNEEIEREAGMGLDEIFNLLGQAAYRRLERRCLDRIIEKYPRAVLETGGGLVADPGTFERLLSSCYTIWLHARPEDHMARVIAQGDHRPMAGNREAMADLKRILEERKAFYSKADAALDTSTGTEAEVLTRLHQHVELAQKNLSPRAPD